MIEGILIGLKTALTFQNIFMVMIGCFFGTIIGMLPGLGPMTAIALMIPITYGFDPATGLILMAGVYYGAVFGGSTSSILLNAPGVPGTVATSFDGYPMAQQGKAGKALAIAAWSSFAGGTLASIYLLFLAPSLSKVSLSFRSPDYFALMILGLTAIAAFSSKGQFLKAMMMVVLGLMLASVGQDSLSDISRFTFNNMNLSDGISFVLVVMATFAMSEALTIILKRNDPSAVAKQVSLTELGSIKITKEEENVYNEWTIISKYHYRLASMGTTNEAIKYQYEKGWSSEEDRAFTFWIRPQYNKPIGANILILSIANNNNKVQFNTGGLPKFGNSINIGDWVEIRGTKSYNGIGKVIEIIGESIVIDEQFIDDVTTTGSPSFNKEATNNFMVYENSLLPPTQYVSFTYTPNWFIMKINEVYYKWKIGQSFAKDEWYAIVINLNATARQLGLFVYNTVETSGAINPNLTSSLNLIFNQTQTATPQTVIDDQSWKLFGCETDLTNIRIWKKPIEEELQSLILSQYVVKDTHLTLLLDNASPELMLQDVTDAR